MASQGAVRPVMPLAPRLPPVSHPSYDGHQAPGAEDGLLVEARLRVVHRGCLAEALAAGSTLALVAADLRGATLLLRVAREEELEPTIERLAALARTPRILSRSDGCALLRVPGALRCPCASRLVDDAVVAAPTLFQDGAELLRVMAPTAGALRALVAELEREGRVTIETTTQTPLDAVDLHLPIGGIAGALTQRQLDALHEAIRHGYYQVPRRTSTIALAAQFGVGRTTFEEHLRKAERAVLAQFGELVSEHAPLARAATKGRGRPRRL